MERLTRNSITNKSSLHCTPSTIAGIEGWRPLQEVQLTQTVANSSVWNAASWMGIGCLAMVRLPTAWKKSPHQLPRPHRHHQHRGWRSRNRLRATWKRPNWAASSPAAANAPKAPRRNEASRHHRHPTKSRRLSWQSVRPKRRPSARRSCWSPPKVTRRSWKTTKVPKRTRRYRNRNATNESFPHCHISVRQVDTKKGDVKSYGFSYDNCQPSGAGGGAPAPAAAVPAAPACATSLCPSEGYESGGSDSGVHLSAASPVKNRSGRGRLMPIGETSGPRAPKTFSSGTSTSGSGGSAGSAASTAGHYESSGYESVIRDSECSSLGSSGSDRDLPLGSGGNIAPTKLPAPVGGLTNDHLNMRRIKHWIILFFFSSWHFRPIEQL